MEGPGWCLRDLQLLETNGPRPKTGILIGIHGSEMSSIVLPCPLVSDLEAGTERLKQALGPPVERKCVVVFVRGWVGRGGLCGAAGGARRLQGRG
jgi:hypothetical protein